MEINKISTSNVSTPQVKTQQAHYGYLTTMDKDRVDRNVKYAAEQNKKRYAAEFSELKSKVEGKTETTEIFKAFGIETEKKEDGKLSISHYKQPGNLVSFKDLGYDENELLKDVKEIKGNADFNKTSLTSIDSLEKVGGKLDISFTKVKSMKNLKEVGSIAQCNNSLIEELPNLKTVGAMANLSNTRIKELPSLEVVKGNLDLQNTPIEKMPALKSVKGDVNIINTKMSEKDVTAEVGGKVKDKKDPVLPIKNDYSYLWDNSDRVEHNKPKKS